MCAVVWKGGLLTMVKEDLGITPFVRFELPCLTCGHNTNNSIPSICTELCQCLCTIHDEVPGRRNHSGEVPISNLCKSLLQITSQLPSSAIHRTPLPINRNHIFRFRIPLSGSSSSRFLTRFINRVLQESLDIVHSDESGGGG